MMIMQKLTGDRARLNWLLAATARADVETGSRSLYSELRQRLRDIWTRYDAALKLKRQTYRRRRQAVDDHAQRVTYCRCLVRQAWGGLHNRIARSEMRVSDLEHYKLPTEGGRPNPTTYEDWLAAGKLLLRGNEEAVAAGFPPLSEPPIGHLTDIVYGTAEALAELKSAKAAARAATVDLQRERAQVDLLMREIARYLRCRNMTFDRATMRELLRDYGYTFVSREDGKASRVEAEISKEAFPTEAPEAPIEHLPHPSAQKQDTESAEVTSEPRNHQELPVGERRQKDVRGPSFRDRKQADSKPPDPPQERPRSYAGTWMNNPFVISLPMRTRRKIET